MTLGAHFLSQNLQRTTCETETLDACIERIISLSSSWKIHVERCRCVLFTGEAMLCHGPG